LSDLRRRLEAGIRRFVMMLLLLSIVAGLVAVAIIYLIYGLYLWLSTLLLGWQAALVTGGAILLLGLIVLGITALTGRRRRRSTPPSGASAMDGLAQAARAAAHSPLGAGLLRGLPPRVAAFGVGIAAGAALLRALRSKPDRGR
jgi:hypothetical protein